MRKIWTGIKILISLKSKKTQNPFLCIKATPYLPIVRSLRKGDFFRTILLPPQNEKITLDQGITTIKIHSRKCISGWTVWEKMDTTQPTSQFDGEEIAIIWRGKTPQTTTSTATEITVKIKESTVENKEKTVEIKHPSKRTVNSSFDSSSSGEESMEEETYNYYKHCTHSTDTVYVQLTC